MTENLFQQRAKLLEMGRAFRQAQIVMTCVELNIFDHLQSGASAAEVAAATGTSQRGMALLLNAAASLGLLRKTDERYFNTPLSEACLSSGGAGNVSRILKLESAFYRRWGLLAEAVRSGSRPPENRLDEQPESWVSDFITALYDLARPIAPLVAGALALPEDQLLRVIDVGGGHGGYSLALAERYPLLTATVFELPRAAQVARQIIADAGLTGRVSVQEGDFQKEELGSGYDVALVFNVLNGEPPDLRPELVKKVFTALKPGGRMVLRDQVLDPSRTAPLEAVMFSLQALLATEAGGIDTRADWDLWLSQAGFRPASLIPLPDWAGLPLTVAFKPLD